MTIEKAKMIYQYTKNTPPNSVHPGRWRAMVKQIEKNEK